MNYLAVTTESLARAAEIIKNGGIAAFPTETVYGLGADAFNPLAIARVFEVKGRPRFDPLIIHIAAVDTLELVADLSVLKKEIRNKLFLLAENLWPGPLSIVLPKNEKIPGIATAGLAAAAIRFPDHETAQKLITLSTGAVAAPSANPFGSLSPTRAEHVRDSLGEKVDIILDGGPARIGLESTVLDIADGSFKILRPGGTPKEFIESVIGEKTENKEQRIKIIERIKKSEHGTINNEQISMNSEQASFQTLNSQFAIPSSPGQLKSHYAPKTPLFVLSKEEIINKSYENGCVFLFFDGLTKNNWLKAQNQSDFLSKNSRFVTLSETGQVLEAAFKLFDALHELDNGGFSRIYAQIAPSEGLGEAINDRLLRASKSNDEN